jgi:hypothetical protein
MSRATAAVPSCHLSRLRERAGEGSFSALLAIAAAAAAAVAAGCEPSPVAPMHPTWADVEPILRANCNHCHGGTARVTGALGPAVFRFDFYDMTPELCGEAALAMDLPALARAQAGLIMTDVTPVGGPRPRMPPAPGAVLLDWERETLQRWGPAPIRGVAPAGNRPPRIELTGFPASITGPLSFVAVLEDPDGQSAVGVIKVGDVIYKMDRPGSYKVSLDTSGWAARSHPVSAVVCDGWANASYELGEVTVRR